METEWLDMTINRKEAFRGTYSALIHLIRKALEHHSIEGLEDYLVIRIERPLDIYCHLKLK